MNIRNSLLSIVLIGPLLGGCTVRDPVGTGAVAGALGGLAGGAVIAGSSSSVSVAQGMGYGLAAGIPAGITIAYVADSLGRIDDSAELSAVIDDNQYEIMRRERELQDIREDVLAESPRGLPADDLKEHVYVGPSLGNRYR